MCIYILCTPSETLSKEQFGREKKKKLRLQTRHCAFVKKYQDFYQMVPFENVNFIRESHRLVKIRGWRGSIYLAAVQCGRDL